MSQIMQAVICSLKLRKMGESHGVSAADDRVVALREVSIPPVAEVTAIIQV